MEEWSYKSFLFLKMLTQRVKSASLKSSAVLILLIITLEATAPDSTVESSFLTEPVKTFDIKVFAFESLMNAIVMVESSGDTLAFNPEEEAYGAFQIRPIRVSDYNKRTGKSYKAIDCYSYKISKEIFLYYAEHMGYPDYESIAKRWNGSGPMTVIYWGKVQEILIRGRSTPGENYCLEKFQSINNVSFMNWPSY